MRATKIKLISFEDNKKSHKILWNELARTGEEFKSTVIDRLKLQHPTTNACYACECTVKHKSAWSLFPENCAVCPIKWHKKEKKGCYQCCDKQSPYKKWNDCKTKKERKIHAKTIANKRWKEYV